MPPSIPGSAFCQDPGKLEVTGAEMLKLNGLLHRDKLWLHPTHSESQTPHGSTGGDLTGHGASSACLVQYDSCAVARA